MYVCVTLSIGRNYKAAEEALLQVKNEKYKLEFSYISWLGQLGQHCICYICNYCYSIIGIRIYMVYTLNASLYVACTYYILLLCMYAV